MTVNYRTQKNQMSYHTSSVLVTAASEQNTVQKYDFSGHPALAVAGRIARSLSPASMLVDRQLRSRLSAHAYNLLSARMPKQNKKLIRR